METARRTVGQTGEASYAFVEGILVAIDGPNQGFWFYFAKVSRRPHCHRACAVEKVERDSTF